MSLKLLKQDKNFKSIEWKKSSRKNKKYLAVVKLKDGTTKKAHFGDERYQQYQDRVPLRLYKSLNHLDKKRREAYRKRHGAQRHHLKRYSPAWFSWHWLW